MPEDLVLTPGGLRPKSLVHKVQPGQVIDGTGGVLRILDSSGAVVADLGPSQGRAAGRSLMPGDVAQPPSGALAHGSGWITYASWSTTGTPVSSFTTTWVVPPAPGVQSGQYFFLFNGIQNSEWILQPVLQWGVSAAGGGSYWAVASWYTPSRNTSGTGGPAVTSSLVPVSPGDILTGIITLTAQTAEYGFSYSCQFQGLADTVYEVSNVQELTQCVETLEAYGITQCSNYPAAQATKMTGISIQTGATLPDLEWTVTNAATECGQHTVVVSDSPAGGEVDLCYRTGAGIVLTGGQGWASIPVGLSNGDGTFNPVNVTNQPTAEFAGFAATPGVQVLTGDFNGDGNTDIALTGVTGWASIPVAFSNGDGTFNPTNENSRFAGWASSAGAKVLTGDFNGDGNTDLALTGAAEFPATIPVAFSNGDGTFRIENQGEGDFASWAQEPGVKVLGGNFTSDGMTGIALTGVAGWESIPVALFDASGNGTFQVVNATSPQVAEFAALAATPGVQVLTGNFGGFGRTDIALTGVAGWETIPVALSQGDGTFQVLNMTYPQEAEFAGWAATPGVRVLTGDFNGDGRTGIGLIGVAAWESIPVAVPSGYGAFQFFNVTDQQAAEFTGFAATPGVRVLTGDFNGDGRTDIALTGVAAGESIPVALSNGDGTFQVVYVTDQQAAEFAGWAAETGVTARIAVSLPQMTPPPPPPPPPPVPKTTVPDVRGCVRNTAEQLITDANLLYELDPPTGNLVTNTRPSHGSVVDVFTTVILFLSPGEPN
jgi:FG-GAP-like repeat